jgi:hypothetical protein
MGRPWQDVHPDRSHHSHSFTVQARDTDGNVSPMIGTGSFSTLSYPAGGAIKGIICQLTSTTVTFSAICWWTA